MVDDFVTELARPLEWVDFGAEFNFSSIFLSLLYQLEAVNAHRRVFSII